MKSRIFLAPSAGLANRLLAVLSAIRMARLFDRELVLVWQINKACACPWSKLFATDFPQAEFKKLGIPAERRFRIDASDVLHREFPPYLDLAAQEDDIFLSSNCIFTYPGDASRGEGFWVYEPILAEISAVFQELQLQQDVAAEVQKIREQMAGGKTLGIHIRRGANENDQVQAVFGRITDPIYGEIFQSLMRSGQFAKCFIASDSLESEEKLAALDPAKAISYRKRSYSRDSEAEAVQDALVDFMGLAFSDHIAGNKRSTYCYLASIYRLIPLTAIHDPQPARTELTTHIYTAPDGSFAHHSATSAVSCGALSRG